MVKSDNLYVFIDPDVKKSVDNMTEEEFNAELEKGYADYSAGRGRPAKDVFFDIRKE